MYEGAIQFVAPSSDGQIFYALRPRLQTRANRPAAVVNSARPVHFLGKSRGIKKLARGAIEKVEEPVAVGFDQQLSHLPIDGHVDEHGGFRRVVVKQVMRGKLEVPF